MIFDNAEFTMSILTSWRDPDEERRYYERQRDEDVNAEIRRRGLVDLSQIPLAIRAASNRLRYAKSSGCSASDGDARLLADWAMRLIPCEHKWIETMPARCEWCGERQ